MPSRCARRDGKSRQTVFTLDRSPPSSMHPDRYVRPSGHLGGRGMGDKPATPRGIVLMRLHCQNFAEAADHTCRLTFEAWIGLFPASVSPSDMREWFDIVTASESHCTLMCFFLMLLRSEIERCGEAGLKLLLRHYDKSRVASGLTCRDICRFAEDIGLGLRGHDIYRECEQRLGHEESVARQPLVTFTQMCKLARCWEPQVTEAKASAKKKAQSERLGSSVKAMMRAFDASGQVWPPPSRCHLSVGAWEQPLNLPDVSDLDAVRAALQQRLAENGANVGDLWRVMMDEQTMNHRLSACDFRLSMRLIGFENASDAALNSIFAQLVVKDDEERTLLREEQAALPPSPPGVLRRQGAFRRRCSVTGTSLNGRVPSPSMPIAASDGLGVHPVAPPLSPALGGAVGVSKIDPPLSLTERLRQRLCGFDEMFELINGRRHCLDHRGKDPNRPKIHGELRFCFTTADVDAAAWDKAPDDSLRTELQQLLQRHDYKPFELIDAWDINRDGFINRHELLVAMKKLMPDQAPDEATAADASASATSTSAPSISSLWDEILRPAVCAVFAAMTQDAPADARALSLMVLEHWMSRGWLKAQRKQQSGKVAGVAAITGGGEEPSLHEHDERGNPTSTSMGGSHSPSRWTRLVPGPELTSYTARGTRGPSKQPHPPKWRQAKELGEATLMSTLDSPRAAALMQQPTNEATITHQMDWLLKEVSECLPFDSKDRAPNKRGTPSSLTTPSLTSNCLISPRTLTSVPLQDAEALAKATLARILRLRPAESAAASASPPPLRPQQPSRAVVDLAIGHHGISSSHGEEVSAFFGTHLPVRQAASSRPPKLRVWRDEHSCSFRPTQAPGSRHQHKMAGGSSDRQAPHVTTARCSFSDVEYGENLRASTFKPSSLPVRSARSGAESRYPAWQPHLTPRMTEGTPPRPEVQLQPSVVELFGELLPSDHLHAASSQLLYLQRYNNLLRLGSRTQGPAYWLPWKDKLAITSTQPAPKPTSPSRSSPRAIAVAETASLTATIADAHSGAVSNAPLPPSQRMGTWWAKARFAFLNDSASLGIDLETDDGTTPQTVRKFSV